MIYYLSPYSLEGDLGLAYNQAMALLREEDWICFTDGDCMWLAPDYGIQIQELINKYPNAGIITCLTNRVGNLVQCYNNHISEDPNLLNHKRIAMLLQRDKRLDVVETKNVISGMCMIIKKSTWTTINGAPEGKGLLTVDNHISQRVLNTGAQILIAQGLYLCHFYRLDTGHQNRSHLIKNSNVTNYKTRRVRVVS